jgi:hypothetical protein
MKRVGQQVKVRVKGLNIRIRWFKRRGMSIYAIS